MRMYTQERKDVISVGADLYQRGLVVGTDGNISVRLGPDKILITGSGFCKGRLRPENLTVVNMKGEIQEGPLPARDIRMHLAVYQTKAEVKAVVHAHPPIITGYSMSDVDFSRIALPEVMFNLRGIAVTDYATPISIEVARGVAKAMKDQPEAQCILLANHGALTFGESVFDAFYKMETLELFAHANLVSKVLGNTRYLDENQMMVVKRLLNGEHPDCIVPLMKTEF